MLHGDHWQRINYVFDERCTFLDWVANFPKYTDLHLGFFMLQHFMLENGDTHVRLTFNGLKTAINSEIDPQGPNKPIYVMLGRLTEWVSNLFPQQIRACPFWFWRNSFLIATSLDKIKQRTNKSHLSS